MVRKETGVVVLSMLLGCSQGELARDRELLGTSTAGLSEACKDLVPVATFSGNIDYTSPTTYSQAGCDKAQVIEYWAFDGGFGGSAGTSSTGGTAGTAAPSLTSVSVDWAGPGAKTQASCTSTYVASYLFQFVNGTFSTIDHEESTGSWANNHCVMPSVGFTQLPGGRYRFAATARFAPTAATTKFRIFSHL